MLSLLAQHRGRVFLVTLTAFAGAIFEAALLVLLTGLAVNFASGGTRLGPYLGITLSSSFAILIGLGTLILRLVFMLASVVVSTRLTTEVTLQQRRALAGAYLASSWSRQSAEPPGRLQELMTSSIARVALAIQAFNTLLSSALSLAALMLTSLLLNAVTTIAALAALVAIGLLLMPIRRIIHGLSSKWRQADMDFASKVSELGALGLEMQTFGVRRSFLDQIDEQTQRATHAQQRAQIMNASQSQLYISLAFATILGGLAASSSIGSADVSVIGAILLLMLRSLSYGQNIASASAAVSTYTPFLQQVRDLTAEYSRTPASVGRLTPANATPIVVTNLTFGYSDARAALSSVSFTIEGGESVGVIGPSGSGKSTLAQLLLGLRRPNDGLIAIDGVNLDEIERSWWAAHTAFVPQDAQLISGTVADNIRFFRTGIDDAALIQAAKAANLFHDIQALPQGFDTDIGPRGGQLSGGQRQRISIARALVGNPSFIVMDEPTSALDSKSENLITETINLLKGSTSVLLIAHRMSTISACDKVLVIEQGKLTAQGSPGNLAANSPFYRQALGSHTSPGLE
ncbi:MAG: ABC transporter ATP-binding protein [Nocardioidaceae bacterium]